MRLHVFLSFRRCPKHPNTSPFDFGTPPRITNQHASARESNIQIWLHLLPGRRTYFIIPGNDLQGAQGILVPSCPAPLEPKSPAPPPRTARITNAITTPENP